MQQKSSKVVIPPSPPPWIHNFTSRSSLAGFEIGIPPGQQTMECKANQIETKNIYREKALPPIPLDTMDPHSIHPGSRIPLDIDLEPPIPPPRNARRFSYTSSPSTTAVSTPKPFLMHYSKPSKDVVSPVSPVSPLDTFQNGMGPGDDLNPAPLVVRQPVPINRTGSKISRLTGCDLYLAAPIPRQSNRTSTASDISQGSSKYSEPSPITSRDGENPHDPDRKDSEVSLDSFVNNYSGWGSWAPSKESLETIGRTISADATHQTGDAGCQKCCNKGLSRSETIIEEPCRQYKDVGVSTSPSPSPSPPASTPPPPIPVRSASRSCNRPIIHQEHTLAPERPARRKSPMTLESLIELERACFRRSSEAPFSPYKPGPISPLGKLTALYEQPASRDSGFASDSGMRPLSPGLPLKSQNSMPVLGREGMPYNPGHARSISRFSIDSDDDDAVSIRSTASARISGAARGMRNSFVSHVRNASLTIPFRTSTGAPSSRLSQVDAADEVPERRVSQHKHTGSNSTAKSVTWTLGLPPLAQKRLSSNPTLRSESPQTTPRRSRFLTVTETLKNPLRAHPASPSTPPPRPKRQTLIPSRRSSKRSSRTIGLGRTTSITRRNSRNTKNLVIQATRRGGNGTPSPNFSLPTSSPRPFANPHYTPSAVSSAGNSVVDLKEMLSTPSSTRGMKSPAMLDEVPSSTRGMKSPTTFDDILGLGVVTESPVDVPPTPSSTRGMKSPGFPMFARRRTSVRRRSSIKSPPPTDGNAGRKSPQSSLVNGRRFSVTGKNGQALGSFDTASRTIGSPILIGGSITMGQIQNQPASLPQPLQERSLTASPALGGSFEAKADKGKKVKGTKTHKASRSFSVFVAMGEGVQRVRGRMGIKSKEVRASEEREREMREEERKDRLRGKIRVVRTDIEEDGKGKVEESTVKGGKVKVKEVENVAVLPASLQVGVGPVEDKIAEKQEGERKWV